MQKKLLVVAVGSALAAIGASPALAQNATVSVFGTLYGEYASINNGNKTTTGEPYVRYDHFQNPGSEIGFRGEEKLGGSLSAWFQCASSADWRGSGNSGVANAQAGSLFCTRNSALGLKGAFGNAFYGNWQTPWNRINSAGNVGSNDTGVFGNAHIIAGTSTTTGMSSPNQFTFVTGTNGTNSLSQINALSPGAWRRRQNNLFTYETPNLSGFSAMGSFTTRNNASAATAGQFKTRLWSLGAQYANGPLFVGLAFEEHKDFYDKTYGAANTAATQQPGVVTASPGGVGAIPGGAAAVTVAGSTGYVTPLNCNVGTSSGVSTTTLGCSPGSEQSWTLAASYTFANNLKLGGSWQKFKADASAYNPATGLGGETKFDTYHIGIDWMISGPHGIRAGFSHAGDIKGAWGPSAAAAAGAATVAQPATPATVAGQMTVANPTGITGTASSLRPQAGPSTSASMYQIRYVYMMSKRTEFTVGASWTKNDANAVYETGGSTTVQLKGSDSSAYGVAMRHTF